jgi:hypothetical protein
MSNVVTERQEHNREGNEGTEEREKSMKEAEKGTKNRIKREHDGGREGNEEQKNERRT